MRQIDLVYRTIFAELGQRCIDAQFVRDSHINAVDVAFPMEGHFFKTTVKGHSYWYHQAPAGDGTRRKVYVGPVSDIEITRRVEEFGRLKDDIRSRRKLVSTLVRDAAIPAAERLTGDIVEALGDAGLFRLRCVLVGTVAFQCYGGLIGVRLPSSSIQTSDADFAQFHSVSVAVDDSLPPLIEVLRRIDPSFREIPSLGEFQMASRFENRDRYRVEFLTPNTGGSEHESRLASMPALGGAAAQPLRFLDFLIHEPVRSVMLHRSGVPVVVPSPERYAVHKLIVASRRRTDAEGILKRDKDVLQAEFLMDALIGTRRQAELADVYAEAWRRGPTWKDAITRGMSTLSTAFGPSIRQGLAEGLRGIGEIPAEFGLDTLSDSL